MTKVLTRVGGGEPATPPYEYLRTRLAEVFVDDNVDPTATNAYPVVRAGDLWLVKAGIVNDPSRSWHEYAIAYRQTQTPAGAWYEADLHNTAGNAVIGFGFAPEGGYQVLTYDIEDGAQDCLRGASAGHYALMISMVDRTIFSEDMSLQAALELSQRPEA